VDDDFDLDNVSSEIDAITRELNEIKTENENLKRVISDNELEDEVPFIDCMSVEEKICVEGIRYIGLLVERQDFDDKDVKNFDVLYKTLRSIKGLGTPTKKTKPVSVDQLLKIVSKNQ
jgi:hypothetical protein